MLPSERRLDSAFAAAGRARRQQATRTLHLTDVDDKPKSVTVNYKDFIKLSGSHFLTINGRVIYITKDNVLITTYPNETEIIVLDSGTPLKNTRLPIQKFKSDSSVRGMSEITGNAGISDHYTYGKKLTIYMSRYDKKHFDQISEIRIAEGYKDIQINAMRGIRVWIYSQNSTRVDFESKYNFDERNTNLSNFNRTDISLEGADKLTNLVPYVEPRSIPGPTLLPTPPRRTSSLSPRAPEELARPRLLPPNTFEPYFLDWDEKTPTFSVSKDLSDLHDVLKDLRFK